MGATLCEMPCTLEAARRAKELGMMVCMGAPNYFRGGSHCGNLSCREAMAEGLVDILCSDFHFPSMLGSVVMMMREGMEPSAAGVARGISLTIPQSALLLWTAGSGRAGSARRRPGAERLVE